MLAMVALAWPGAGWYKAVVLVDANERTARETNSPHPAVPPWVTREMYTQATSTPLSVEVAAGAPAGAYTLNVTSK